MTPQARLDPATEQRALSLGDRLVLAGAFSAAARRYWLGVFPHARRELRHWRRRSREIPDPVLRRLALQAQRKRGNVEGATAFAAFAPRTQRAAVTRALVAFQSAFDYLDVLAEQPRADPVVGARALHQALLDALAPTLGTESTTGPLDHAGSVGTKGLSPGTGSPDYYASYPQHADGGYLAELVGACATALATLPSYPSVAPAARRAAERIVEFQSLNLSESQGDHDAFERWARALTPAELDLRWWETAGGGGSPLCVYALIAAAAAAEPGPAVPAGEVEAIENAYFPWIGGLHSLLDHLVDRSCDAAVGQRSLIDYYTSPQEAAARMHTLAERATSSAGVLARGHRHTIMLAAVTGFYLSDGEASAPGAVPIAGNVKQAIGGLVAPAMIVFKARRLGERLTGFRGSRSDDSQAERDERDSPVALGLER